MTIGEVNPSEAYALLQQQSGAQMIDVRTAPEWSFVGLPDLSTVHKSALLCEWRGYPTMAINGGFGEQILAKIPADTTHLLFLCRSGARSAEAGMFLQEHLRRQGSEITCLNIAEGFEGDLNADGHRGEVNGWKSRSLPWRQG